MQMRALGKTGLSIAPIVFGGSRVDQGNVSAYPHLPRPDRSPGVDSRVMMTKETDARPDLCRKHIKTRRCETPR